MPLGKAWGDFVTVSRRSPRRFHQKKNESNQGSGRILVLRVVCFGLFLLLLGGLAQRQIFEGSYYKSLADGNRTREVPIFAPRGIIYDRNGNILAGNLPAFRLEECDKIEGCSARVISKNQAIDLETKGLKDGQTLLVDSARSYAYPLVTAHLLGYLSEVTAPELKENKDYLAGDKVGRGGVEEAYEKTLAGVKGKELIEVDALGNKLRTLSTMPSKPGSDLNLAIDLPLQKTAYEQIKGVKGAVIVTNPQNGEVLAIVSSPSFDPNLFTDLSIDPDERAKKIDELFNDDNMPLFDRAIAGTYPPGSTFKIITATAGLESKKIDENFSIDDPGILVIGPYKFPNWKYLRDGGRQGVLNVVSALKVSNDIFFYRVGEMVGVDTLADWALHYGLTKQTGIDLPGEKPGSFPTADWRTKFARDWYLGDTYHLAIGQGDMLVTPLQVNRWTSVIANGGKLCQPHVVQGNLSCKDMGLHQKTLDLIKRGMIEACSPGGTAYPLFNFQNPKTKNQIQIACKTGTAEFGDPKDRTHAWLTAFAPAENPQVAVTVIVEAGGEGSDVAAPIVKKILETWFNR